jgi:hypothetical protein
VRLAVDYDSGARGRLGCWVNTVGLDSGWAVGRLRRHLGGLPRTELTLCHLEGAGRRLAGARTHAYKEHCRSSKQKYHTAAV